MKEGEGIVRWLAIVITIIIIAIILFLALFVLPRTVKAQTYRSFGFQIGNQTATIQDGDGPISQITLIAAPILKDNRIWIAVRDLEGKYFGAKIYWDPKNKTVTIYSPEGWKIVFTIGKTEYFFNKEKRRMDVAPFIDKDSNRTFIPVRFFAEALKAREITFISETLSVIIKWPRGI